MHVIVLQHSTQNDSLSTDICGMMHMNYRFKKVSVVHYRRLELFLTLF